MYFEDDDKKEIGNGKLDRIQIKKAMMDEIMDYARGGLADNLKMKYCQPKQVEDVNDGDPMDNQIEQDSAKLARGDSEEEDALNNLDSETLEQLLNDGKQRF